MNMADRAIGQVAGLPSKRRAPSTRSEAVAALYDAHVDEVYRFVYRRCRDHALTQDIVQETFMAAVRTTTDPDALTIGWLMTVARRRLFDVLRTRMRSEERLRRLIADANVEETLDLAERLRVEAALDELSVDYRLVLTLHYFDGHTVAAIAEQLGRSYKSVESLITRARKALRNQLGMQGGLHDV